MSDWTTPKRIAELRRLCRGAEPDTLPDDDWTIVSAMPHVLDALEAAEWERDGLDADVTEARAILAARDGETLPDAARRAEKAREHARQDATDWRAAATSAAASRDEARAQRDEALRIAGSLARVFALVCGRWP